MDNGGGHNGALTEGELLEFAVRAKAATVAYIATMAACDPSKAEKFLDVASAQVEDIAVFIDKLMDQDESVKYPIFGIRLHLPGGKKYLDYRGPKHLPRLFAGGEARQANDLGMYLLTVGMLTSIEGRAIMMAQGYRIEFIHGRKTG